MTRSGGKRSNTRHIASRGFRKHGPEHISTYLQNFRLGDHVDIVINSCIHKGMPYKFYHGKTGKIFNISKSSVGIKIEKTVGHRKILKKINVKIEHIRRSKSKVEFIDRTKSKDMSRAIKKHDKNTHLYFRKNPCLYDDSCFFSFRKVKMVDPEPYCIIV
nr:60S ribosomal protein L21 [Cryptomonas sp.]